MATLWNEKYMFLSIVEMMIIRWNVDSLKLLPVIETLKQRHVFLLNYV